MKRSPQGISCDIFDKCSQPEYAGIDMICMSHVHSNISITAKLGVINSQFYRFLRLCSSKDFFISQMVSLIVLLKNKGKDSVKRGLEGCSIKKNSFLEFQHVEYSESFCIESSK
jgi:hypothetical protein